MSTKLGIREHTDLAVVSVGAAALAQLWSRPTDRQVGRWRVLCREHPDRIESLLGSTSGVTQAEPDILRAEYDLRIGGPRAQPGSPFESMWRDDIPPQQRWGRWPPVVAALDGIYAALAIAVPPNARSDEITVELAALARAAASPLTEDAARALITEHLNRWLPEFLHAVVETTSEAFYRDLADATERWLSSLLERRHGP